jgi:hypothetical protein
MLQWFSWIEPFINHITAVNVRMKLHDLFILQQQERQLLCSLEILYATYCCSYTHILAS